MTTSDRTRRAEDLARVELPGGLALRPATVDDLEECARIWREGIDDYQRPMNFPPQPDSPGLRRIHAHTLATDPTRFWVAVSRGHGLAPGPERVIGFGSAVDRAGLWFLSMLFVEPGEQGRGVGRAILDQIMPPLEDRRVLGTATDSAQPISNGLYASLGIAPRMPLFHLIGRPDRPEALPPLPPGIEAERIADDEAEAWLTDDGEMAELDREVVGFAHPQDHRFVLAAPRSLFVYRDRAGRLVGYGYTGEIGM